MPQKVAWVVYPLVCGLHGLLFGVLYAPVQALMFGLSWDMMLAWIIAGLPFDAIHAVSNILAGLLIVPLTILLNELLRRQIQTI